MHFVALLDHIGTIAFAYSGVHAALRIRLNLMGAFIVAMLTASAGGAVSQVLVGASPTVLHDLTAFYLVVATFTVAVGLDAVGVTSFERSPAFVVSDTMGLVAFAMIGAHLAIDADLSFFGTVVIAFLSAVGGGMIRDILVNEVPTVLDADLYGPVAALCGALVYVVHAGDLVHTVPYALIFVSAVTLRLAAYRFAWRIPSHPRLRPRPPADGDPAE